MEDPKTGQHGVVITLREVWEQWQETRSTLNDLASSVGELVAVNRRLDSHSKSLATHDARLDQLETWKAVALSQQRPRAPWYSIVGAVVGIVSGVVAVFTLITIASKLGAVLG